MHKSIVGAELSWKRSAASARILGSTECNGGHQPKVAGASARVAEYFCRPVQRRQLAAGEAERRRRRKQRFGGRVAVLVGLIWILTFP